MLTRRGLTTPRMCGHFDVVENYPPPRPGRIKNNYTICEQPLGDKRANNWWHRGLPGGQAAVGQFRALIFPGSTFDMEVTRPTCTTRSTSQMSSAPVLFDRVHCGRSFSIRWDSLGHVGSCFVHGTIRGFPDAWLKLNAVQYVLASVMIAHTTCCSLTMNGVQDEFGFEWSPDRTIHASNWDKNCRC